MYSRSKQWHVKQRKKREKAHVLGCTVNGQVVACSYEIFMELWTFQSWWERKVVKVGSVMDEWINADRCFLLPNHQ